MSTAPAEGPTPMTRMTTTTTSISTPTTAEGQGE